MLIRHCFIGFVLASLLLPASAPSQVSEVNDAVILRPTTRTKAPENRPDLAQAVKQIIRQTNEFRQSEKHPKVEPNARLTETAQGFARFMARTGKYGHTADGNQPADRATKQGYDYCLISENIAYQYRARGFTTKELAREFFEGWKDSPGHRKNMLDPDVMETGVAIARSEETGYYYAVQMFGRPKSKAIEFSISNQAGVPIEYMIGEQTFSLPPRSTRTHRRSRPSEVTFRWGEDKGKGPTIKPSTGDRLVIRKEGETFQLKRE